MESRRVLVTSGVIIDASETDSPRSPKGCKVHEVVEVRRYVVERTFGSMRRWFGAGVARYVGLEKTHAQHVMEAIAYNLYRTPGIIVSNCVE